MPNVQQTLNAEIRRLARKEVNASFAEIAKKLAFFRKEISGLAQRIKLLESVSPVSETKIKAEPCKKETAETQVATYAKKLKKIREKLEMTQANFALLLGVSSFTISCWEKGKNEPRLPLKQRIQEIRDMNKREIEQLKTEKGLNADYSLIPGKIREFRIQFKLSLNGFAKLADIALRSAVLWEQGAVHPRGSSADKLFAILNLTPENVKKCMAEKGIKESKQAPVKENTVINESSVK